MNDVSAVTGPAPILEEEEEEDGDVAAEGVEDKDIELVMSQVTRLLGSKVSISWLIFFPHSGKRLQRKGCESPAEQRQRHCQRDHGAHDVENQTLTTKSLLLSDAYNNTCAKKTWAKPLVHVKTG